MSQQGKSTTFHQECMMLFKAGVKKPNPRKQFVSGLISFIKEHQMRGHEIPLMLDANEEDESTQMGMIAILRECSLSNLHKDLHPDLSSPVTHDRGSKTIDYILGSAHCQAASK